jgi:rhodanese-related sulfurtransferase
MEKSITAAELNDLIAAGKQFTFIDVRRKEDFDQAPETIAGAQWKNPAEVEQWIQALPEQQEVIVYCVRGGSVSQSVRQRLADSGRTARFVAGGLEELTRAGQV